MKTHFDLARFQREANERRHLLQLGKIVVDDPADTKELARELARRTMIAASSPRKPGADEG